MKREWCMASGEWTNPLAKADGHLIALVYSLLTTRYSRF